MNLGRWRAGKYYLSAFKSAVFCIVIFSILIFISQASASQKAEQPKLNDIVAKSDIVIHGKVKSINAKWINDHRGRHIYTYASLECLEYLKGAGSKNIIIEFQGGTAGDITERVTHTPSAKKDEEMIIALAKDVNCFRPSAGIFGKFTIKNGKAYGPAGQMTVNELKSKIRKFIGAPSAKKTTSQLQVSKISKIETAPGPISALSIYNNTVTSSSWYAPGLRKELIDFGSSGGGTVTSFTIGYVTTLADPGIITIQFYSGTTSATRGSVITSFEISGLSGSTTPGTAYAFSAAITLDGSQQFELPAGAFGYSYEFANTSTGVWLSSGGAGNVDGFWIDRKYNNSPFGGDPFGGFFMSIEASGGGAIPEITSINPPGASAGTDSLVTISGSNFGAAQGSGTVNFFYSGGQPTIEAPVTSWSDTSISCIVPVGIINDYPASSSSGPVSVTNNNGVTSSGFPFIVTFGYGEIKWPLDSPVIQYWINENCASATGEGDAVQAAANSWNAVGAQFDFQYAGTHSAVTSNYNSKNEIMWGNAPSGAIAVTYYWASGETMLECDIVMGSDYSWDTSGSPSSSQMDVQTITVHEMGHWLNLRDLYGNIGDGINDNSKIMYGYGDYGEVKRTISAGDRDGIIWIYGQNTNIAPEITSSPETAAIRGELYVYDVNATGMPEPNFALIESPAGMNINPVTGLIEWIPDVNQVGEVNVAVEAINQAGSDIQNYTITVSGPTFCISGYVMEDENLMPINEVNILTTNEGGSAITDINGYYQLIVDYNWSGSITPVKNAYSFEPNSRVYSDVNQNYSNKDFSGTLLTFKISGRIQNECNVPIQNAFVNNNSVTSITDSNGVYEVWVDYGWSGSVSPNKKNYTFEPNSISYIYVTSDLPEQNFTAFNRYDLNCDTAIDSNDLILFAFDWLMEGPDIRSDFYADWLINFLDFSDFAAVWQEK